MERTDIYSRVNQVPDAPPQTLTTHSADDGARAFAIWLVVLVLVLPIEFKIGPLAMSPIRVLLLITIIPTTVRLFLGRYGKTYPIDYLLVLHGLWSIICIGVNNPNRVVENAGAYVLEFLGAYVLARALIRSPEDFYRLIRAIVFFTVLSLPFAVIESQTDVAPIIQLIDSIPGLDSAFQVDMPQRMGLFRSQVVFAHPIHYGLFSVAVLSLTWIGMKGVMSGAKRHLSVLAIFAAVFFSLSSGALLPAAMQGGLIMWNYVFRNAARRWLILVGLCVMAYITVDLLSNRTPFRVFLSYATFSPQSGFYRALILEWGLVNVWNNPVFGLGLRNWIRPWFMHSGSIDNYWLVMAIRYGIPGFLLIAFAYLDAMFRIGRRKLTPGSRTSNLRLAWMLTFIGLSFTLTTVHIWDAVFTYVFLLLGAGMWIAGATDAPAAPVSESAEPTGRETLMRSRPATPARQSTDAELTYSRKPTGQKQETAQKLRYTRFGDAEETDANRRGEEDGKS